MACRGDRRKKGLTCDDVTMGLAEAVHYNVDWWDSLSTYNSLWGGWKKERTDDVTTLQWGWQRWCITMWTGGG